MRYLSVYLPYLPTDRILRARGAGAFDAPFALWRKVKAGHFPKPVKLSERVTAWRVEDVRAWLAAPVGL